MSQNKLTKTNSRFLYETASAATPTSWTVVGEGYTWVANGQLFKVTADDACYNTVAYVMQRTNPDGDFEDAETITLNLPDGNGIGRTDVYSSFLTIPFSDPPYTTLALLDTFEPQSEFDRVAFDQQVMLEREIGIIFDYVGTKFRGTETSRADTKAIEPGGFVEGFELILTTSREQWSDASIVPILGAHVVVAGVKYRVEEVVKNNAHYQLNLSKRHGG